MNSHLQISLPMLHANAYPNMHTCKYRHWHASQVGSSRMQNFGASGSCTACDDGALPIAAFGVDSGALEAICLAPEPMLPPPLPPTLAADMLLEAPEIAPSMLPDEDTALSSPPWPVDFS